ncbi:MAG: hypothetical protein WC197_08655 [Candidatus Gastranaerophilaceae bacterium]|jgi:hypothetical protein
MIKELFVKTFKLVKYNLILIQPLLIFMLLFGMLVNIISGTVKTGPALIVLIVSFVGLFCAFLAGWFSMFHKCVQNSMNENIDELQMTEKSLKLFHEFIPGIGKYFIKVLLGGILYVVLYYLFLQLAGYIGQHYIGFPAGITQQSLVQASYSEAKSVEFVNKLSSPDKILLVKNYLLILFTTGIFSLITMFWLPAIIADDKNPFSAYVTSFLKVFQKPFQTMAIFVSYWLASSIAIFINILGTNNFIIQFLGLILYVFVVVYFITMIFLYYEGYSKNNCTGWTDRFR